MCQTDQKSTNAKGTPEEFANVPLAFEPGTMFRYSCATDLVRVVIESITKQPLDTFMKERIFA